MLQGDSLELLPTLEGEFDLIFADPPYFLSNGGSTIQSGKIVSVNKGKWDEGDDPEEIDSFNEEWIIKAKEKLSKNGSIMISGTYHNIFSLGRILQKLDFKILNIITWQKTNPPPNFSCRYLTHSTEQIIWARKSAKHKHIFNYELMKKLNGDKQMKDVWALNATLPWEKKNGKHPTQKPLALLIRLILMATNKDSKLLDPFSGSATTGLASYILGRDYLGLEMDEDCIRLSFARLEEFKENPKELIKRLKDLQILGLDKKLLGGSLF